MIDIPAELAEAQVKFNKEAGRAFIAALPNLAARFLDRWELRLAGTPMHGVSALVLPVDRADGTPAVLKLQIRDHESEGEPVALRLWAATGRSACSTTTSRPAPCCWNASTPPGCSPTSRTSTRASW